MKSGYVAIVGRPNSGKSTLLNNILGHKVSITSPKPQTTRFPIQAVYEDVRGQIIFIDTPGIFGKVHDPLSKSINPMAQETLSQGPDVVVYLADHTRDRDMEENKSLGLVRNINTPKILAINKIDIKKPTYLPHYKFMEEEFDKTVMISGLYKNNLNYLLDAIFELLPEGKKIVDATDRPTPALNIDSKIYIAEIVREKAFLFLRKEVPYSLTCLVDEITHRNNNIVYIKTRIITSADRYKKMIIGENGRMIKEIGMAARKELETATNQKVYIDIQVETNPHWIDQLT
ncbi:GTPase Era [Patescibacteria group bacterium]|nr:GTPase Era [Patescibacteria group bacterium]MCL5798159.1 GTPase Era [Patescibacteria group bacterium]